METLPRIALSRAEMIKRVARFKDLKGFDGGQTSVPDPDSDALTFQPFARGSVGGEYVSPGRAVERSADLESKSCGGGGGGGAETLTGTTLLAKGVRPTPVSRLPVAGS